MSLADARQLCSSVAFPVLLHRLESAGIAIEIQAEPLRLPGRVVYGEFDPLLRRIVLYDAAAQTDRALVRTFLHEAAHALAPTLDELRAGELAEHLDADLTAADRQAYARELRSRHSPAPAPQPIPVSEMALGSATGVPFSW